ncbi:MAG: hypothetical protein AAF530_14540 [Pseudomonadota bacterium]
MVEMEKKKINKNRILGIFLPVLPLIILPTLAFGQEGSEEIDEIASMVRDQGYSCDAPSEMEKDTSDSTALEEAWIISCDNGRYRVKILGDTGAEVTPVL